MDRPGCGGRTAFPVAPRTRSRGEPPMLRGTSGVGLAARQARQSGACACREPRASSGAGEPPHCLGKPGRLPGGGGIIGAWRRRAASTHFAQTTCRPTCSILVTPLVLPVPRPSSQGQARRTFSGHWLLGAPAGRCPLTRPIRGLVPGRPPPGRESATSCSSVCSSVQFFKLHARVSHCEPRVGRSGPAQKESI